jgi:hypothetical protein
LRRGQAIYCVQSTGFFAQKIVGVRAGKNFFIVFLGNRRDPGVSTEILLKKSNPGDYKQPK